MPANLDALPYLGRATPCHQRSATVAGVPLVARWSEDRSRSPGLADRCRAAVFGLYLRYKGISEETARTIFQQHETGRRRCVLAWLQVDRHARESAQAIQSASGTSRPRLSDRCFAGMFGLYLRCKGIPQETARQIFQGHEASRRRCVTAWLTVDAHWRSSNAAVIDAPASISKVDTSDNSLLAVARPSETNMPVAGSGNTSVRPASLLSPGHESPEMLVRSVRQYLSEADSYAFASSDDFESAQGILLGELADPVESGTGGLTILEVERRFRDVLKAITPALRGSERPAREARRVSAAVVQVESGELQGPDGAEVLSPAMLRGERVRVPVQPASEAGEQPGPTNDLTDANAPDLNVSASSLKGAMSGMTPPGGGHGLRRHGRRPREVMPRPEQLGNNSVIAQSRTVKVVDLLDDLSRRKGT